MVPTSTNHPPSDVTTRNGCRTLYGRRVLATFPMLVIPDPKPSHRLVGELGDQMVLIYRPKSRLERFLQLRNVFQRPLTMPASFGCPGHLRPRNLLLLGTGIDRGRKIG